jgi:hypothetical protein
MLDDFQAKILKVIAVNRAPKSVVARGSVLQYHAFRLSDDQDLFHDDNSDLLAFAKRDIESLEAAGFFVELDQKYDGLIEAKVSKDEEGLSTLQWVQSGLVNFFASVPDSDFGYRLHIADLAVNKVHAAATRKEVRDFVDLYLIHQFIMPLWHAVFAAPGKSPQLNPVRIVEELVRKNNFRQEEIDSKIVSAIDIDAAEMGRVLAEALREVAEVAKSFPARCAGNLFVNKDGNLVNDLTLIRAGLDTGMVLAVGPIPNGSLPSNPEIDRQIVERLIEEYGYKGEKLIGL